MDARAELLRFEAENERSLTDIADETRRLDAGWAIRTHDLPWVWTLNQLCVTGPVAAAALAPLADAVQGDQAFRHVVVRHGATADAAEPVLAALGWHVERDVVMALDQPAPLRDGAVEPTELTEDQMLDLMGQWLLEERGHTSAEGLAQVLEWNRREGRRWGERRLGVVDGGGAPLAVTKVRRDGTYGWVEDVYTTPTARGRGYARSLVTHAVHALTSAGATSVSIVADADDWPQHLYADVGFRPIGGARIFHREAEASSAD
jgi:GNAT superfamily N-acetyltransferase